MPPTPTGKAPQGTIFNQTVAAGQTVPITKRGNNAYIVLATGTIDMRPRGPHGTNEFSTYTQGTGFENTDFDIVDLRNSNTFSVVVSVWVGESGFIDKRLILATSGAGAIQNVVNPLWTGTGSAPAYVEVPDISGGSFTDINGKKWLAISRVQILISNLDSGNVMLLQKAGNHVFNTGAVFAIQPATEVGPAFQGSYCVVQNGGTINGLVAEVYQAIPA
jgi:hypothetical protein